MDEFKCENCDATSNVKIREYDWWETPRRKYGRPHAWTIFEVELCDACWERTQTSVGTTVSGRDWEDAYDSLDYMFFQTQEHRDGCDASTSEFLGIDVDTLRALRQMNSGWGAPDPAR